MATETKIDQAEKDRVKERQEDRDRHIEFMKRFERLEGKFDRFIEREMTR